MIGRLTGKVTEEDDGGIVVDVNGVGYEVIVPLGTIGRCKPDDEGRVTLFVHTHVREDALTLFGFASDGDRVAFRTLIGVSNVGPKTAIHVLSALPAHELGQAIARKELGKLTSISGVGKKTAERLLIELKNRLSVPVLEPVGGGSSTNGSAIGDVREALSGLGYGPEEIREALRELPTGADAATLLRDALKLLGARRA
jgi:holliday junction DNA helicase RuvA